MELKLQRLEDDLTRLKHEIDGNGKAGLKHRVKTIEEDYYGDGRGDIGTRKEARNNTKFREEFLISMKTLRLIVMFFGVGSFAGILSILGLIWQLFRNVNP